MNKPRARVLIVDDSAMVRALHAYILQTVGFDTIEAENGFTALEMLRQWHCDVAIVDMNMPRMDGLTLIKRIRAEHDTKDLPVIIVSVEQDVRNQRLGIEAGANVYVVKPTEPAQLVSHVQLLIGTSSHADSRAPNG
jgi:two-component system chemotaxis response regulator CheY